MAWAASTLFWVCGARAIEIFLPGLVGAAVQIGVAVAERILRIDISITGAALEFAVARAVDVVLPGVANAAVCLRIALAVTVFQPGLVGAAVKFWVADAKAVSSPSVAWAAFSV